MFETQQPGQRSTWAWVVAGSAVGMLLAFGLCGAGAEGGDYSSDQTLTIMGAGLFVLSGIGLVVGLVVVVVEKLQR